ncbi:hypothetical protein [Hymenobacter sp.]|uniref:hypothetical protein n=1 Tax=Hymenobacter sp. TaxID=1898978 RepID=UPI002D81066C|nr:hypothetical protein [Hymenobacter sp.]
MLLLGGGLLGLGVWACATGGGPRLPTAPPQPAAALRQMARDTARAARARAHGQRAADSARAAAQRAALLHLHTHRHASLRPAADTSAQQLQQFFSAY